jgi:sugar lactone lactonase YvrE
MSTRMDKSPVGVIMNEGLAVLSAQQHGQHYLPRLLWPDALSVATDGHLYVTANQLHRQARYHRGKDLREKPYSLIHIKLETRPVLWR